jgi:hypothetical protein
LGGSAIGTDAEFDSTGMNRRLADPFQLGMPGEKAVLAACAGERGRHRHVAAEQPEQVGLAIWGVCFDID